jgi:hypothetical protein
VGRRYEGDRPRDLEWPQPGAELEYRLGAGPITIGDRTVVVESEPSRLLVLRAELRHLGPATKPTST